MKKDKAPKVSIIWLNYNSLPFIDIALKSLKSLFCIDYSNYEIIIVDNASTDRSINMIEEFVDEIKIKTDGLPPIKVIKNTRNLGFTFGNFIGYKNRCKHSEYVAIINNDLIVEPSSLRFLIAFLKCHQDVGAVQGKVITWNEDKIDNCGWYFDSMFRVYARYHGLPMTKGNEEALISYTTGCYSVFRVTALEKCGGLFGFILPYFGYFDDATMCLRLWRKGYKVMYVPVLAGRHRGSASFRKLGLLINYLDARNRLSSILNLQDVKRFMVIPWIIYFLSRIFVYLGLGVIHKEYIMRAKYVARILTDSFSLANKTQKIEGYNLEPYIKLRIFTIIKMMFFPKYITTLISSLINSGSTYKIKL
jgi:GT2 family glycosyltransferase